MGERIGVHHDSRLAAENMTAPLPLGLGGDSGRSAALVEQAPDAIFLSDAAGRYVEVNEAGCRLFRCPRAEILGQTLFDFATEEQAPLLRKLLVALRKEGDQRFEWLLQRPDGSSNPIEVHSRLLPDGQRLSIVRDIGQRKEREQEQQLTAEAMERLHAISSLFLRGARDEEVLLAILDAAIATCRADFGCLQVVDPGAGGLRIAVQRGLPATWVDFWGRIPKGQGACGMALEQGARVIVEDVDESPIFAGTPALAVQRSAGVRAVQSTPLLGRSGERLGMISTHHKTPQRPSEHALRLLDMLTQHAAALLEHRLIEAMLIRAEAKSTGILAASADAIISVDPSGVIKEWNHGAEQMFGYGRAEALGMTLDRLLPARYRAAHREHVARFAVESGRGRRMDHQSAHGQRKNGEQFPIDAVISSVQVGEERILTVAVRDVTAQKRSENDQRLLAEVGGVLSSLDGPESLRRVPAIVVGLLAEFAVLFTWNGATEPPIRIAAASRDPEKAWAAEHLMEAPPKFDPAHPICQVLSEQRAVFVELDPQRYEAMAQSAEHLHALRTVSPRSALIVPLCVGKRCVGALGLSSTARCFDPQDLRLVEELARRCALFAENARLHQTERKAIRARDEVLGIVAHDLRNPLNAIHLQLQLLLRRRNDPADRWKEPAESISNALQWMNRLIQDLLDITCLEAGALSVELAELAPDRIIAEVIESQRAAAAASAIELRSEVAPGLHTIYADRQRIQQAFENLLSNAFKFTPRGGQVTLGASALEREIVFSVSDTGSGIPAEHQAHLFDRFWQAERTDHRGVGLGLAIVHGIVTAHGGRLWVESTLGRGTTFYFTLPIESVPKR